MSDRRYFEHHNGLVFTWFSMSSWHMRECSWYINAQGTSGVVWNVHHWCFCNRCLSLRIRKLSVYIGSHTVLYGGTEDNSAGPSNVVFFRRFIWFSTVVTPLDYIVYALSLYHFGVAGSFRWFFVCGRTYILNGFLTIDASDLINAVL